MIFLIGSIVLSSLLTLVFKACQRYNINIFQAIVFNYITCVITGSLLNKAHPFTTVTFNSNWFLWALLMGVMFIVFFNITGVTTQKMGVAVASVANKLSLVIPFIFSIILYNEKVTLLKIIGIVLALLSIILVCFPADKRKKAESKESSIFNKYPFILPALLFIGSGLMDTLIKYTENTFLNDENKNAFLIMGFATAGVIGSIILIIQLVSGKAAFQWKALITGICIGIPNYFSIWCLVKVLKEYRENSSAIIPINNMGIVLFSTLVAWLLFKEKLAPINWLGIALAVGAICLIAYG